MHHDVHRIVILFIVPNGILQNFTLADHILVLTIHIKTQSFRQADS